MGNYQVVLDNFNYSVQETFINTFNKGVKYCSADEKYQYLDQESTM